jgi:hypothetical protein
MRANYSGQADRCEAAISSYASWQQPLTSSVRPRIVLDDLVPLIEQMQAEGAVVLIKWDGERLSDRCTVVVSHKASEFTWRADSDDIRQSLLQAFGAYKAR